MQLRNRLHRRESWYLLTAKVNREHAAASVVCIAQLTQKLMLLVVAQPRVGHLGAHLHLDSRSEEGQHETQACCPTFIARTSTMYSEEQVSLASCQHPGHQLASCGSTQGWQRWQGLARSSVSPEATRAAQHGPWVGGMGTRRKEPHAAAALNDQDAQTSRRGTWCSRCAEQPQGSNAQQRHLALALSD